MTQLGKTSIVELTCIQILICQLNYKQTYASLKVAKFGANIRPLLPYLVTHYCDTAGARYIDFTASTQPTDTT